MPVAIISTLAVRAGLASPNAATFTVVTGLVTVTYAMATLSENPDANVTAVLADTGDQAGSPAAGSIIVRSRNGALPAVTGFLDFTWLAIGEA